MFSGHFYSFKSQVFVFSLVNIESEDFVENTNMRDYTKSLVSLFFGFLDSIQQSVCVSMEFVALTRNKYYYFFLIWFYLSFRQTIDPLRWLTLYGIDFLSFDLSFKMPECFSFCFCIGSLILLECYEDAKNDICLTIYKGFIEHRFSKKKRVCDR